MEKITKGQAIQEVRNIIKSLQNQIKKRKLYTYREFWQLQEAVANYKKALHIIKSIDMRRKGK